MTSPSEPDLSDTEAQATADLDSTAADTAALLREAAQLSEAIRAHFAKTERKPR